MKYTVKNEDGQLTFDSLTHLRQMYEQGLVSPEDQIQPEGSTTWRRADALPELQGLAPRRPDEARWHLWGMAAALCLTAALYALVKARSFILAGALMVPVLIMSQRAMVKSTRRRR